MGRLAVELGLVRVLGGDRTAILDVLRRIPPERLSSTPELAICGAVLGSGAVLID